MQMFTLNVCFLWTWLNISHKFNDTLPLSGNLDVIPHSIAAEHETHQKDLNSWWCWNIRFVHALNWIEKWKCGYISNLASFWRHLWRCIRKYIPRIVHMVVVGCGLVQNTTRRYMGTFGTLEDSNFSLKTKDHQLDNFVITGGTVSCRHDNLRCHQWRQSCQIDDLFFSMFHRLVWGLFRVVTRIAFWFWRVVILTTLQIASKHDSDAE